MTYIIGDVHGEFDTLIALVNKLAKQHELIFVGDLIDRGPKSKDVISFVRKNKHRCVLGNHEEFMMTYGSSVINSFPKHHYANYFLSDWLLNGGKSTLISYGLAKIDKYDKKLLCIENKDALKTFEDDLNWIKTLPLFIKLDANKGDKSVVISHSSMANVWKFHNDKNNNETFKEYCLWNRKEPKKDVEIFNIFGHTQVENIDTSKHFLNIDTGCTYGLEKGYGELSAYCIETSEIIHQRRVR
jgi:serine/threonine protein phosphatase 1